MKKSNTYKRLSNKYITDFLSPDLMLAGGKIFKRYYSGNHGIVLNPEHDTNVSYILNNYMFRSDSFDKDDIDDILFAGCSYTFGYELPIEHTWSKIIHKEIGISKFKNLGTCGASYQTILQNIYAYFRNFGNPKSLFLLMPNLERYEFIEDETVCNTEVIIYNEKNEQSDSIRKVLTKEYVIRDFVSQIRTLEDFCKNSNIDLYWGTWDISLAEILSDIPGFNNYVQIFDGDRSEEFLDYALEHGDKANRYWKSTPDGHAGIKENLIYAKAMMDAYNKHNVKS